MEKLLVSKVTPAQSRVNRGADLHNMDARDGEEWRWLLYQAHLSDVFVPDRDRSAGLYWRIWMDSGEYGIGLYHARYRPPPV
ncbi:hypothetical protein I5535_14775 [Rhodobacteraceae bacterium F11138]|nr:hypothetical protein [Rhodobacteraceae bacterium F11138]